MKIHRHASDGIRLFLAAVREIASYPTTTKALEAVNEWEVSHV